MAKKNGSVLDRVVSVVALLGPIALAINKAIHDEEIAPSWELVFAILAIPTVLYLVSSLERKRKEAADAQAKVVALFGKRDVDHTHWYLPYWTLSTDRVASSLLALQDVIANGDEMLKLWGEGKTTTASMSEEFNRWVVSAQKQITVPDALLSGLGFEVMPMKNGQATSSDMRNVLSERLAQMRMAQTNLQRLAVSHAK
jgi:hypothetical protein